MQEYRVKTAYIEHKYINNNVCTNYTFKATCSCFFVGISSYTA